MKTKRILYYIALCLVCLSCAKEIEELHTNDPEAVDMTFRAVSEGNSTSKTELQSDGTFLWSVGDSIKIFCTKYSGKFVSTNAEPASVVDFSGSLVKDSTRVWALYPYQDGASYAAGEISFSVPQIQYAKENGFSSAIFPCMAKSENNELHFKNICGGVQIRLTRDDIRLIEFSSLNSGDNLVGSVSAGLDATGIPVINKVSEGYNSVVLSNKDGSCLKSGVYYYITLFPGTLSQGFKVSYYTADKVGTYTYSSSVVINRSKYGRLTDLDKDLTFDFLDYSDLSSDGTANCYIVNKAGNFKFKGTMKGGSSDAIEGPASASVIWESFGTDIVPSIGNVVTNVSYSDGYVKFSTPSSLNNGNAVIAVKDASGTILWSWHIWVCKDYNPDATAHDYFNNAGTMMDRNLGALSATPGDVGALGLIYQWGRKDPFPGSSSISNSTKAATTLSWPEPVNSDASCGTISYAVEHPTTFITTTSNTYYDWYYSSSSTSDNTRWQTTDKDKGLYDPCPVGWRVPDGGDSGLWTKALGSRQTHEVGSWSTTNKGMDFGVNNIVCLGESSDIWYPASGTYRCDSGLLKDVGEYGYYWSSTSNDSGADVFKFMYMKRVFFGYSGKSVGFSVRCVKDVNYIRTENLSESGTANCYIVNKAGRYKFKAVKGNSVESIGDIKGVKVLWETFGTDTAPAIGDLIDAAVSHADNYITFSTNGTYKEGNAVIAAYSDANCTDGNVLWSWHIWLTDKPEEQVYNNNAGTMMDRNLGATSAYPGDVASLGLLYQWGRKDPFLSSSSISSTVLAASTLSWPSDVISDDNNGTISYALAHPTTFITDNSYNGDWYYTGSDVTDNNRWQSAKTIYDPCPSGWRIPDGGNDGVWSKSFGSSDTFYSGPWYDNLKGMNFGSGNACSKRMQLGEANDIWFPAAGVRSRSFGDVGNSGGCWSCYYNTSQAYDLFFNYNKGYVCPAYLSSRSIGLSVRCFKE